MQASTHSSLQHLSTFGLDAKCQQLCLFDDLADLPELIDMVQQADNFMFLGDGSNTVFCEDYAGLVIKVATKGIYVTEDDEAYRLHVQAGENWHELVEYCLQNHMPGLENLALIPGGVGAAPIQNIGAYGVELARFCDYVDVVDLSDGQIGRLAAEDCQFGYRDSVFKRPEYSNLMILGLGLSLPKLWQPELSYTGFEQLEDLSPRGIFDHVIATRQAKLPDPAKIGNVGSFFKNPVINELAYAPLKAAYPDLVAFDVDGGHKLAAAWLLDQAGGKQQCVGGAGVHQKQALVLVNQHNASGQDVLQLAASLRQQVYAKFSVLLEPEVRLVGAQGLISLEAIDGVE